MTKEDAEYIWDLIPNWVKESPEGLCPTFYGTGSAKGDKEVKAKVEKILGFKKPTK